MATFPRSYMKAVARPSARDVNWDVPLTTLVEGFIQDQENFAGWRAAPVVSVQKESDVYWQFPIGTFSRHEMTVRAENTEAEQVGFERSTESYQLAFKGLGYPISDRQMWNARNPLQEEQMGMRFLGEQALIDVEISFRDTFMPDNTTTWGNNGAGAASRSTSFNPASSTPGDRNLLYWNNSAGTPIDDVITICSLIGGRTGRRPNVMVMGRPVWDALHRNAQVIDVLKYGQTSGPVKATRDNLAYLMELEEIIVSDAVVNTAAEGADVSNEYIIGKHALLMYRAANPDPSAMDGSAGYTFMPDGSQIIPNALAYLDNMSMFNNLGTAISSRRQENTRSYVMEIDLAYAHVVSGSSLGCLLRGIVQ